MLRYRPEGRKDKTADGVSTAWTIHDKINEIRGKLALKQRDQEAYYISSQQQIEDNEVLIASLRYEIQESRVQRKLSLNAHERVIEESFQNHKESQLAMRRYTMEKAMEEKNEHVFDKVGFLNAAKHEVSRKKKKKKQLTLALRDMKLTAATNFDHEIEQRLRVLMTSIEKMRLKNSSARFIQKTYMQILRKLEQENLKLPGRLQALEQSIRDNRAELEGDLYQLQLGARKARNNAKAVKERMESKIVKEKRRRDKDLSDVRRRFKKMYQKEEKEYRTVGTRRRNMDKGEDEAQAKTGVNFWDRVKQFWEVKQSMDHLRDAMSVTHPSDIALCFQTQINRHTELEQHVENLTRRKRAWAEEISVRKIELDKIFNAHELLIADTAERVCKGREVMKTLNAEVEEKRQKALNLGELLHDVVNAVATIHQKTTKCDWIPKQIRQRHGTEHKVCNVVSSGDLLQLFETDDIVKVLHACGDKLYDLMQMADKICEQSEDVLHGYFTDEGQELLAVATSSAFQNTRVCIADEDDLMITEDFFGDDVDTNDQYLSREAIKTANRKITETSQKRRMRTKKD